MRLDGFSVLLAVELARRHMNIEALAEQAGVSRQTLSTALNSERVTDKVAEGVARAFGVTVAGLRDACAEAAALRLLERGAAVAPSPAERALRLADQAANAGRELRELLSSGAVIWAGIRTSDEVDAAVNGLRGRDPGIDTVVDERHAPSQPRAKRAR